VLREVGRVRQRPGEAYRRWFTDERVDLVVWQDRDGALLAFQLAYDKPVAEHALSWCRESGFLHEAVDDGERVSLRHKRARLLVADGAVPWQRLQAILHARGGGLDGALRARLAALVGCGARAARP